ncbi:nuclear transcription factor Y subunit C [Raphidocelis subcapitata]|uniref:Nuclear transcription factor Y subunit C n=1 Tax=Raphidocelis subcapitata TaxID=307507 RepID=A0A2V0P8L2_9CHLO|nr:nuclear transcription factor Y subunit C [Raphidocelis subcapitata]|eukprot:GBF96186.1 nuclear transcription factor Y subunit C [Raphidocelis subcapitata]
MRRGRASASGSDDDEEPGPRGRAGGAAERLAALWRDVAEDVEGVSTADLSEFKNHQLPLARIKKIMKSDEDVRMISAEAPCLFAKACELFILQLSLKAWLHAAAAKRRTLQRSDVAAVIHGTHTLDFLQDIVPLDGAPAPPPADPAAASGSAPHQPAGGYGGAFALPGGAVAVPLDPAAAAMFARQQRPQ